MEQIKVIDENTMLSMKSSMNYIDINEIVHNY